MRKTKTSKVEITIVKTSRGRKARWFYARLFAASNEYNSQWNIYKLDLLGENVPDVAAVAHRTQMKREHWDFIKVHSENFETIMETSSISHLSLFIGRQTVGAFSFTIRFAALLSLSRIQLVKIDVTVLLLLGSKRSKRMILHNKWSLGRERSHFTSPSES